MVKVTYLLTIRPFPQEIMSAVKMIFLKHIETFFKHIENNNKCAAVFRAVFFERGGGGWKGGGRGSKPYAVGFNRVQPKI